MKKIYLTLFTALVTISYSNAQWTTGNDISNTNPGFVGIGTTNPVHKLDVNGNGGFTGSLQIGNTAVNSNSTKLFIKNESGNGKNWALSAGANSRTEEGFHIYNWTDNPGNPLLSIDNGGSTAIRNISGATLTLEKSSTGIPGIVFQGNTDQSVIEGGNDYFTAFVGGSRRLTILSNGNLGIGTTQPDEKLSVKGKIHAQEIKVDLNIPGPDYVFDNDYRLLSLPETDTYIKKHHHLPEIPSAEVMKKEGIIVSEMQMKLLQKIEELTLHLIEQGNMIEKQAIALEKLQNVVKN